MFLIFMGCENHKKENHHVDLQVYRFENEFFSVNDSNFCKKLNAGTQLISHF